MAHLSLTPTHREVFEDDDREDGEVVRYDCLICDLHVGSKVYESAVYIDMGESDPLFWHIIQTGGADIDAIVALMVPTINEWDRQQARKQAN